MYIEISKSDFKALMSLTEKAISIIKSGSPPPREYNVARQLGLLKRKINRRNNIINSK
jgi:hypothetical protein